MKRILWKLSKVQDHGIRHHYFPSYGMATHNNFHIKYAVRKLGTRKIRARRFKTSQCVGNLAGMGAWVLTRGCSDVAAHAGAPDISFFDKSHQKSEETRIITMLLYFIKFT